MGNGWRRRGPAPPPADELTAQAETVSRAGTAEIATSRRPRRKPKVTAPGTRANSVSSLPRPTPRPGWKWVPRWRTMISPALTTWPPNRFTPRRWAFESRPLRDDDAPFLCAMSSSALRDVADHDAGQGLTVPLPLVVGGLVLELVDVYLPALAGPDDLAGHGHAGQRLRVGGDGVAVDEQHGRERDGVTGLPGQAVDGERVTDTHLVLRSTGLDDCVHH